ncbi:hypothetical protein [Sinorhizobium fredii]|uniref:Uncharacterized protein n=2 Tax=Rhizobium fredii TaxID=380 RepID=A0A844AB07_RHIFR|nr:hypothetical protein [Sinorhizobium fredii]AWI56998.1 hypothetical protein AB395_00001330 [Sinorhizobium fredii CCBAU 45436]AWM24804.1 hypothetical protein AOX55_00001537 [Sinorhizobium fredii CCBAU 25509]KSV80777.1 hypothetical protein N181_07210 [Sinorhizobium fredii USDA 205]MCG5474385.1 hypothetical protein [Sinorhizobium fredii]MQW93775.1 hypothetical protein [Sinorhizobium fredii]
MKTNLRLAVTCATIVAAGPSIAAEGQAFLPPEQAAAVLADGQPWSALAPDGKTLKVTLKKDGTGSIRGPLPFTLSVTWTVKGDGVCINGKMGTRCLRFNEVAGGLQGWDGDKPDLKFSR